MADTINYDTLADAMVRAMNRSGAFRVDAREIHKALLFKPKRRHSFVQLLVRIAESVWRCVGGRGCGPTG